MQTGKPQPPRHSPITPPSIRSQINKPSSNFFTLPNIITLTRIGCTPFIGQFIMTNQLTPALALFGYSCVTDFLDGYIARKWNMKSVAGTILDPIADKLLMVITTLALTVPMGPQIIPICIASLILGRDFMLGVSGIIMRFTSLNRVYGNVTWSSYWNLTKFPSVEVKPTLISKWNTFLQMIYLGCGGLLLLIKNENDLVNEDDSQLKQLVHTHRESINTGFTWLGYIVGTTTVLSGTSYIFSKKAVTILPIGK